MSAPIRWGAARRLGLRPPLPVVSTYDEHKRLMGTCGCSGRQVVDCGMAVGYGAPMPEGCWGRERARGPVSWVTPS